MTDELLTAKDAAKYLDISETEFNRRVRDNEIKPAPGSVKLRGRKYRKADLDAYREEWQLRYQQVNVVEALKGGKVNG